MLLHTGQGPGWQLQLGHGLGRMPNRTLCRASACSRLAMVWQKAQLPIGQGMCLQLQHGHGLSRFMPSYTLGRARVGSCKWFTVWQSAQLHTQQGQGLQLVMVWQNAQLHTGQGPGWQLQVWHVGLRWGARSLGKAHDCTTMPKPASWSLRVEHPDWPF